VACDPTRSPLLADARRLAPGGAIVVGGAAGSSELLVGRDRVAGADAAYVCRGRVCDLPVTTAKDLAVALGPDDVLGWLDDYPTRSGYLITPVVVWANTRAGLSPNPAEVASVHRIPLDELEQADVFDFVAIPESTRRVIRFRSAGQFIHAPTAAMMYQFREVLAGRDTRVAELEQPVFAWK